MTARDLQGRPGQRGQVMPLFALTALVIVGAIALAVDYGYLTDQHRNLQAFADHAAIAGAEQLTPSGASVATGRQAALKYIRDNLGASFSTASGAPCVGGMKQFTADVTDCQLPSPYTNYRVTIMSPGKYAIDNPFNAQTLSVEVTDTVANSVASVLGINTSQVGAVAQARSQPAGQVLPTALYTDGCINATTVAVPVIVDGDVYVNECTVKPSVAGGFCAMGTSTSNGSIVIGPQGFVPGSILQGQTIANCQAQLAGIVTSTGRVRQVGSGFAIPALPPPPQGALSCGGSGCVASYTCANGTVDSFSAGAVKSNCYNPGYYNNTDLQVANNLNPGVYYVNVDSGNCYADTGVTSCGGVYFTGNTMNANLNGVVDKCWAAANVPSTNTFFTPCPDGLVTDPTVPADPQCAGSPAVGATAPLVWTATATLLPAGSTLAANTTYYVRISALGGSLGSGTTAYESAAPVEVAVTTTAVNKNIHVNIPAGSVGETNGYRVYISTVSGQEQLSKTIAHPAIPLGITTDIGSPTTGAPHYPIFDNSQCLTGFHNIPHSKDSNQNFGVTFVLTGKAGMCMGTGYGTGNHYCIASGSATTVLINPYCASGFTPNPESSTCTNRLSEDGAYAVYGSSIGGIHTSGTLAVMNMSGTVYLPRGTLQEDLASRFILTPGQMVLHDATISISSPLLTPLVYYGPGGAVVPSGVTLIQ